MMFLFKLLSNPITKLIASKTMGAISHKIEKDKVIRTKEIESMQTLSIAQLKSSDNSWKDEILTILISGILLAAFIPYTQPYVVTGFELLATAPEYFWYIVLIVFSGSFGVQTIKGFKKK